MNKLLYWRSKRGLTVKELSEKSEVAAATITRIEKGRQKAFVSTAGKLAQALEIDVSELVEFPEETLSQGEVYRLEPEELALLKEAIAESDREDEQGIVITTEDIERMVAEIIAGKERASA